MLIVMKVFYKKGEFMKKIKIIICIGFIIMVSIIFIYNKQNTIKIKIKKGTLTNTGAALIVINNHKKKYSYNNDLKIYEKKETNGKKLNCWKENSTLLTLLKCLMKVKFVNLLQIGLIYMAN